MVTKILLSTRELGVAGFLLEGNWPHMSIKTNSPKFAMAPYKNYTNFSVNLGVNHIKKPSSLDRFILASFSLYLTECSFFFNFLKNKKRGAKG